MPSGSMLWYNQYQSITRATARRDGAEVAGWTLDREIWVRFLAYPQRVCGPSNGKEVKDVFGHPGARVEVGSAR